MGSSRARALLGGALVIVMVAVAGEIMIGIGPAGASRERSLDAKLDKLHERRPAAATRLARNQLTAVALAAGTAIDHARATAARRDAIVRYVAAVAAARAAAAVPVAVEGEAVTRSKADAGAAPSADSGAGSDTLACIRAHESDSSGGYTAVNSGSGAGGAYQALPSTWSGYGGYERAEDAPPEVQDQWAQEAIASSGTRPWAGSGC